MVLCKSTVDELSVALCWVSVAAPIPEIYQVQQVFRVKKLVGRRGAPELELLAVVIVLFAPILHESLTNSNFAMLFINITVFKDVCKRVSFVG